MFTLILNRGPYQTELASYRTESEAIRAAVSINAMLDSVAPAGQSNGYVTIRIPEPEINPKTLCQVQNAFGSDPRPSRSN